MSEVIDLTLDASSDDDRADAPPTLTERLLERLAASPPPPPPRSAAAAAPAAGPPRRRGWAPRPPPPATAAAAEPTYSELNPSDSDAYADADGDDARAPSQSAAAAPPARGAAAAGARAPKRSREEVAAAAAARKATKAAEAAARKRAREYDSAKNVLKYFEAIIDSSLMQTATGLRVASALRATHERPEAERLRFRVAEARCAGLPVVLWARRVPADYAEGGAEGEGEFDGHYNPGGGADAGAGADADGLVERLEPHALLVFEAEDFAARAAGGGLRAALAALAAARPGARPHLLVVRLSAYLTLREGREHRAAMAAGGSGAGGSSSQAASQGAPFNRAAVDDAVARLAVECPAASFLDARSPEEAAAHVAALHAQIAKRHDGRSAAARWLGGGGTAASKKGSAAMAALLSAHPVPDDAQRAATHALAALPGVGPRAAHAAAARHRSLGALIAALRGPGRAAEEAALAAAAHPGPGGRRVGPAAARALAALLTSEDPDLLVG
jgi:hypothetical protein